MKLLISCLTSILIGVILIVCELKHAISIQNFNEKLLELKSTKAYLDYSPCSLFNSTILNSNSVRYPLYFFFLLPLMASLPSIIINDKTAYCSLHKKKFYLNLLESFALGCVVGFSVIMVNFLVFSLFIPAVKPEIFTGYYTVVGQNYDNLYVNHPYIYTIIYSIITILYCGAFSLIFTTISRFFSFIVVKILVPLFFSGLITYFSRYNLWILKLNPLSFLRQCQFDFPIQLDIVIYELIIIICLSIPLNLVINHYEKKNS